MTSKDAIIAVALANGDNHTIANYIKGDFRCPIFSEPEPVREDFDNYIPYGGDDDED